MYHGLIRCVDQHSVTTEDSKSSNKGIAVNKQLKKRNLYFLQASAVPNMDLIWLYGLVQNYNYQSFVSIIMHFITRYVESL